MDYFGNRFGGTNLVNPNFAEVARSMGAEGITVGHADQIGDALMAAVASDKPTVLNLLLTRELAEPFRRDAFRQPVRLLEKYKELSTKLV
jgi:sulfoacetaldehyde acetyltransferase